MTSVESKIQSTYACQLKHSVGKCVGKCEWIELVKARFVYKVVIATNKQTFSGQPNLTFLNQSSTRPKPLKRVGTSC